MVPEGNFKEFQELTDEGLVSSARERFSTGNILGSQTGRRRSSVETNYIDKNHIDSLTSRFEAIDPSRHIGIFVILFLDGLRPFQMFPLNREVQENIRIGLRPDRVSKLSILPQNSEGFVSNI